MSFTLILITDGLLFHVLNMSTGLIVYWQFRKSSVTFRKYGLVDFAGVTYVPQSSRFFSPLVPPLAVSTIRLGLNSVAVVTTQYFPSLFALNLFRLSATPFDRDWETQKTTERT